MKRRSSPLDDVFQELRVALDEDGGLRARITRRFFARASRSSKAAMLLALTWKWRPEQPHARPGHEPLNFTPREREWGHS
jgi:hypothetical protein